MVLWIRGHALPTGEPLDLYTDGDRWTTEHPRADLAVLDHPKRVILRGRVVR